LPNIITLLKSRRMRRTDYVARIGEKKNARGALMETPEGRGGLGRTEHRWEDNMRMDLAEIDRVVWI
jgi:hypothetical protein